MATLVAVGDPQHATAEQARAAVERLQADVVIRVDRVVAIPRGLAGEYHVHTTHGAAITADTRALQEALQSEVPAKATS